MNKIVITFFIFFSCACNINCQSGDGYLFTAKPQSEFPLDDEPDIGSALEPAVKPTEGINKVARNPLTSPPCLYPYNLTKSNENEKNSQRRLQLNPKDVLTTDDLYSDKVQLSGALAIEKYLSSRNGIVLELKQYLGGCKHELAGEVLYLIFSAEETRFCQNVNCTGPIVFNQECRARILIRNDALWNPYYVNCHSPEFYALPWKGVNS